MKFSLFYFLLFFSSCYFSSHVPTKSELQEVMNKANYDQKVIKDFPKFQALADVLNRNFDTTIKLAESRDEGFNPNAIGTYCYFYTYNSVAQYTNIKDLPNFVYKQIDSIWRQIGEDNMAEIELCTNRKITVIVKNTPMPYNIAIGHVFIWNAKPDDRDYSFDLMKDTVLSKNGIYRIGVAQMDDGW